MLLLKPLLLSRNAHRKHCISDRTFGMIRRDTIDLVGHSTTCLVQLLGVLAGALGNYWIPTNIKWLTRFNTMSIYGVLSALHIALSASMRRDFMHLVKFPWRFFRQLRGLCWFVSCPRIGSRKSRFVGPQKSS